MSTTNEKSIDLAHFFTASWARQDRWRALHRVGKTLAGAEGRNVESLRQEAEALLTELEPLETFCGYPGPGLMAQVRERLQRGDWTGFARLTQRISAALLSNSYRDDTEAWKADEEGEARFPDILPPTLGRGQSRKPYFEVLVLSAGEPSTWPQLRDTFRRLRRTEDEFVYEPVVVGSFEGAILATVFNYDIQAVVIVDGLPTPRNSPFRPSGRSWGGISRLTMELRAATWPARSRKPFAASGPSWTCI